MVLTLLTNKIDLQLTEKQSMAQIVCNELAQLTWQSSSDLFVYRLTHLRDLSESWQKFDASQTNNAVLSVVTSPSTANMEESTNAVEKPVPSIPSKAGIITRSKNNIGPKLTPRRRAWDEDYASTKKKTRGKRKVSHADSVETKQREEIILKTEIEGSDSEQQPADDNVAPDGDGDSEMVETGEPEGDEIASNGSVEMSSENVDSGLSPESSVHAEYSCAMPETFDLLTSLTGCVESDITELTESMGAVAETDLDSSDGLECKACGIHFKNKHKLRLHRSVNGSCKAKVASKHSLEDLQCKDCGIICTNKSSLRNHRRKDGACKADRVVVPRERHPSAAPMDGGGTCSFCERVFTRRLSLIKHIREHRLQHEAVSATVEWIREDEKAAEEIEQTSSFQCTECEMKFSNVDAVCWHVRVHCDRSHWQINKILSLQSGDFKCSVCDRQFQSEEGLVMHQAENEAAHECLECGRRIQSALFLRIHRLVHRQHDKPARRPVRQGAPRRRTCAQKTVLHPCPVCSRVFKHAVHLDIHMTMHTGVKNFVCHICARQFATKGQLKRHIMIHDRDGKPSFDCAQCHKRFFLRDTLQRHVRAVHDKERRHLCSLCGWPFAEKHQLRKHMNVHSRNPEMVQYIIVNQTETE